MKMKFPNRYSERPRYKCSCGDRIIDVFTSSMSDDGSIELAVSGKKNLYDEIQSHKDSVDMKTLLLRYESGDVTALEKMTGQYLDVTMMPKDLIGVLRTVENAKNEFEQLPLDVRSEYDFDVNKFIADIGSDKWLSIMNPTPVVAPVEVKEEKVGEVVNEQK